MNSIRLALAPTVAHPPDVGVGVWVDGQCLIDLVRRLESPWWQAVGSPHPDGQYVWVPARVALLPNRHLLGEPAVPWCGEYSPVVVCNCGEYACRAYAVRVEATSARVTWAWAEFPPEEARLGSQLPPFTFDRGQYEAELARVSDEYRLMERPEGVESI
jgi:hypothetical protein